MAPLLPIVAALLAAAADVPPASGDALLLETAGDESPVWARAGLLPRYTWQAGLPSTQMPFDASAQVFAAGRYLTPGPAEDFASGLVFASAGWEATSWLGFRLDLDSGLVRSQRFPTAAAVCTSPSSPSGLAVVGSGVPCTGSARWVLATTTLGASEVTSNGQSFSAEASQTAFVRQLYAEVTAGRAGLLHARVGRQRLRIGDGFVYDDWGLGLDVDLDLGAVGPPFAASASIFYPSRAWPSGSDWSYPVVAATAEWTPSLGEYVGLWGAWSRDATGDASAILVQGLVESDAAELLATAPGSAAYRAASRRMANLLGATTQGSTWLGWAGVAGRLEVGDTSEVRFTAGASFGSVSAVATTATGSQQVEVPVLGWMVSARYTAQPGAGFTLSPFFVWLTGSSPPSSQRILAGNGSWDGFLAISPYITATNLFFQGGIAESYADRRASGSGVNARGVVAPGLQVGYAAVRDVDVTVKAAWLFADSASSFGGASYGPEVDLNLSWSPWRWVSLLAEADVLAMGNFFPGQGVARKFIVGVNLVTP